MSRHTSSIEEEKQQPDHTGEHGTSIRTSKSKGNSKYETARWGLKPDCVLVSSCVLARTQFGGSSTDTGRDAAESTVGIVSNCDPLARTCALGVVPL